MSVQCVCLCVRISRLSLCSPLNQGTRGSRKLIYFSDVAHGVVSLEETEEGKKKVAERQGREAGGGQKPGRAQEKLFYCFVDLGHQNM